MHVDRDKVEAAINECKAAHGEVVDGTIGPELRILADVWGRMIYFHQEHIDLADCNAKEQAMIAKWVQHKETEIPAMKDENA